MCSNRYAIRTQKPIIKLFLQDLFVVRAPNRGEYPSANSEVSHDRGEIAKPSDVCLYNI